VHNKRQPDRTHLKPETAWPARRRIGAWHATSAPSDQRLDAHASERALRVSRLVPLWPSQVDAPGEAAARRVVDALERALRGERRRGRAGHWSYDINRHLALARTVREERLRLALMRREQRGERRPSGPAQEAKSLMC